MVPDFVVLNFGLHPIFGRFSVFFSAIPVMYRPIFGYFLGCAARGAERGSWVKSRGQFLVLALGRGHRGGTVFEGGQGIRWQCVFLVGCRMRCLTLSCRAALRQADLSFTNSTSAAPQGYSPVALRTSCKRVNGMLNPNRGNAAANLGAKRGATGVRN